MLLRCPVLVVTFLFFFPATRVNAAGDPKPIQQNFSKKMGESVTFQLNIPKGALFKEVLLRTTLRKNLVAFWQPGAPLNIMDPKYSGRVAFSENTRSFNISGLRMADGELYEASISPQEPVETVINTYRLSVFNINATATKLDNSSCSLSLLCQAGMGPGASVTYHWTNPASRTTLARDSRLQVIMDPADKNTAYACTASVTGFHSDWIITPYEEFCRAGVAGLFKPGFLACSYLKQALLLPVLVSVLMLP